jgi:CRP-like cAMP-binding protein
MKIESLEKHHIFDFLTPEQIDALSNASRVIKLKPGETVYRRGEKTEYFYVVLDGLIQLRLSENGSASILIDELTPGAMFGSCISPVFSAYFCTAQCAKESELLQIRNSRLKEILDQDCCLGYAIQSKISQIYFKRYMDTMKKLQAGENASDNQRRNTMADRKEPRTPDYVPHQAARPLKYVKDREGNGWLCDKGVNPRGDLRKQGCWRCDEMAFPTGGR